MLEVSADGQGDPRGLLGNLSMLPQMIATVLELLAERTAVSLCIGDVDGLSAYNVRHGHDKGDAALEEMTAYLQQTAGRALPDEPVGRMVYRTRGDEFALVLPRVDADQVCQLLLTIHEDLYDRRVLTSGLGLQLGAATAPQDGWEIGSLWLAAEARLVLAKQAPSSDGWRERAIAVGRPCGFSVGPPADRTDGQGLEAALLAGDPERLAHMINDLMLRVEASERLQGELARMAYTDPLTQLPNQRAFNEQIKAWIARGQERPFTLMLIDGDRLKQFNTAFGYEGGNRMIRRVGRILVDQLPPDAFLARWLSGDEFVSLVPHGHDAEALARRFRRQVAQDSQAWELPVTISMGLASFPDHGRTGEELVQAAVKALQVAKDAGGDAQVVAPAEAPD